MSPSGRKYKVKLDSGRVLGPLDLDRVRALIEKKHITGRESARIHPDGEWVDINQIEEIAEVLLGFAQGRKPQLPEGFHGDQFSSELAQTVVLPGATQVFPTSESERPIPSFRSLPEIPEAPLTKSAPRVTEPTSPALDMNHVSSDLSKTREVPDSPSLPESSPKTEPSFKGDTNSQPSEDDPTRESLMIDGASAKKNKVPWKSRMTDEERNEKSFTPYALPKSNPISEAQTVVFQRSEDNKRLPGKRRMSPAEAVKGTLLAIVLGVLGYQIFLEEPPKTTPVVMAPIRPRLPDFQEKSDPQKSAQLYLEAMKFYLLDTVPGYKKSAEYLRLAAGLDSNNVKAVAMLASSYLNLIDSSNKDENYFEVISKLIEMSRVKSLDLPETVIADVEYYIFGNKADAAQSRIVEYTKTHQVFGREMFFYIAEVFFARGDYMSAARYLGQIADIQAFSAKVFYLRGQLAEKFDQVDQAILEYEKAIKFSASHAKSRLRIAALLNKKGALKSAEKHLEFIASNPQLLAAKDLSHAYFLHSQLSQINQQWDIALGDMERAVKLNRENHDYLLELYTLRAKAGEGTPALRDEAKMYFYLGEGEKMLRSGKTHDALTQFLSAKQANPKSPIPHVKIGDMFSRFHDLQNAKVNFKLAADRAPNNIEIWSKYIDILIKSYEWTDAQKAMDKFRNLPVPQSAIDKAAADMYAKQGRYTEAIRFYQKAMARDTIDPGVYIAYANSLMAIKDYKDAPFFFALALRFDPLNSEALIGTAKCVAGAESIDRAISMLQDELQKESSPKAEILAAIAEFQIQKGDWQQAQLNVEQAMSLDPDFALPWKLQAQIFMNREGAERGILDKALQAYQSYSERNASDPSGYLERFRIFVKKSEFEKAAEELEKIFSIYPKYPGLHYYKASLYSLMRNHKTAIEEFQLELKNNPNSTSALKGLAKEFVDGGNPAEALKHLTKAMELNPQDSEAKADAAYANFLLKNYSGAIGLYQAALAYDPANPTLYKRLGIAYREAGDRASAYRSFRKYLEMEPDAPDRAEFEGFR